MTTPDRMTAPDRLGELAIDGDRTTMTFRRHLRYPIERVWAALTDGAMPRSRRRTPHGTDLS
jgi:hypothetical protein